MKESIFTAYFFGLIITIIMNIYNLLLSKYLRDSAIFRSWNNAYRLWILIILSILTGFILEFPSLVVRNIVSVFFGYYQFKLYLILIKKFDKYRTILVISTIIITLIELFFTFIYDSILIRASIYNSLFLAINLMIGYTLLSYPGSGKIKNLLILTFILVAMFWFTRLVLFFIENNQSIIIYNVVNLISLYSLIPIITLQNISIILYLFDQYHHDINRVKEQNISLQKDSVFNNFLNSLFHEINTPLGIAMTGMSSIIKKKTAYESDKEILDMIYGNLEKIVTILNDRKLIYGTNDGERSTYLTSELDNVIKRIIDKNFTTKNISMVTSYHSDVLQISLRSIFSILLPILEFFQIRSITNDVLVNFISDNELEVTIVNQNIFNLKHNQKIILPSSDDFILESLSEDIHLFNNLLTRGKNTLEISYIDSSELYKIVFY